VFINEINSLIQHCLDGVDTELFRRDTTRLSNHYYCHRGCYTPQEFNPLRELRLNQTCHARCNVFHRKRSGELDSEFKRRSETLCSPCAEAMVRTHDAAHPQRSFRSQFHRKKLGLWISVHELRGVGQSAGCPRALWLIWRCAAAGYLIAVFISALIYDSRDAPVKYNFM
jgi:hypothetical protein